jgi:endo-1,3(4)-beta-glucanase
MVISRVLQSPNYLPQSSISYLTTKGYMYGVVGNVWNLAYALPTITWNAPRAIDKSCTSSLSKGIEYDIKKAIATPPTAPEDFYFFG